MFKRKLQICRHSLPGPANMRGLRIGFVSDVHISGTNRPAAARALFEKVASLGADLLLWGGDYAESADYERAFFVELAHLKAPLGMYGVLGNNDKEWFGSAAYSVMRRLAAKGGMRLLVNEETGVPWGGGMIRIGGLDEWKHGLPSARRFFRDAGEKDLRILITHYPHSADAACRIAPQQPDLILSGHTHGGQIRLFGVTPYSFGYGRRYTESRHFYISGWREIDGAHMLVSNGAGESLLPVRIGAPRQIHLITLV